MLNENLERIILSNSREPGRAVKVKIRPVYIRDELKFQETLYRGTQVFHENLSAGEMTERLMEYMEKLFRQAEVKGIEESATVLVSKKGTVTVKRKKVLDAAEARACERDLSHNRTRQYILKEGVPADFLVELGVQTPEGGIIRSKYNKFRQINRYLEFIEDILGEFPLDKPIRIIDFGCGKSYLTFAMYYYLNQLRGRNIKVTGLDLKEDVIRHCNELAHRLNYSGLHFEQGDIQNYEGSDTVDMVVSLHACDRATDYALEKAVKWGAKVIMAVPCCQHELNGQMSCEALAPIFQYGVIKERMAALITDALRAKLLEGQGYDTQILEFIDMEHTPKNLLIRAVKGKRIRKSADCSGEGADALDTLMEFLHVNPTLKELV